MFGRCRFMETLREQGMATNHNRPQLGILGTNLDQEQSSKQNMLQGLLKQLCTAERGKILLLIYHQNGLPYLSTYNLRNQTVERLRKIQILENIFSHSKLMYNKPLLYTCKLPSC